MYFPICWLTNNSLFAVFGIQGDKLVRGLRAAELARLLSLEKSVRGAIKLVTALKLPILAERFSAILEVTYKPFYIVLFVELIIYFL